MRIEFELYKNNIKHLSIFKLNKAKKEFVKYMDEYYFNHKESMDRESLILLYEEIEQNRINKINEFMGWE